MILEKIASMLAEICDTPAEEITAESKFADLGIDSLDVTEILMKLEDEFGVTLEMDPSSTSEGDLSSKIEEQQKEKP